MHKSIIRRQNQYKSFSEKEGLIYYNFFNTFVKLQNKMSKFKKNIGIQNIPLFIDKLSNILEDQTCFDYIRWTSSGEAFNIKDVNKFTDVVLPKYFKHNNFSSFIRQLNMYGFNKIRHDEGENVYINQNFKRDQKQLLLNIKRKINQAQKQDKIAVYTPAHNNNLNKELGDLKLRQRNLENMCKQLIDQNNRILEQNNLMMKRLSTEQKQKNNKMEQLLVSLIMARGNNQLTLPSTQQPRMITMSSQTKPDYGTNFEEFRQFLQDSNGLSRLQEALRKFQSEEKKRNKSKNFTIVNQTQTNSKPTINEAQKTSQQNIQSKNSNHEDLDQSNLSLGDFLNLDEISHNSNPQTPL